MIRGRVFIAPASPGLTPVRIVRPPDRVPREAHIRSTMTNQKGNLGRHARDLADISARRASVPVAQRTEQPPNTLPSRGGSAKAQKPLRAPIQ